jgi:hypothetical protein
MTSSTILPISTGTFTQPYSVEGYTTQEQWDQEFRLMKDVGMSLWIYQWTGDSKNKTAIYPTAIPGFSQSSAYDQVGMALKTAQKYSFQVFMGLAFNDDWWGKEGSDREWLLQEAAVMNAFADELYARYYARYPQTFAGWYINWEMDNAAGYNYDAGERANMVEALNAVSRHLDELNPALPSSIAPFFNAYYGSDAHAYTSFWQEVLPQTSVDIVMFQDGVGVGHATVEEAADWFSHLCPAVQAAGKQCWSDLENFNGETDLTPAAPERIIAQHQAEAPWVERIVTFSFVATMSPANGVDPRQYAAYKAYVTALKAP